jgi:dienelactone hydrolase
VRLVFTCVALFLSCVPARAADTRADFLKLIDRSRVALAAQILPWVAGGAGIEKTSFSYMSEAGQRVTGLMFRPKPAAGETMRRPAVIAMHATGEGKESMSSLLRDLAARGFVGVAIDARYHGERAPGADGEDTYIAAILRTWRNGGEHPIFYDTAWDILRLVDFLETRPEVDAGRIGALGFSKGGAEAFYAAAADPRIAVVVPCLAVRSFAWELDHDMWQALATSLAGAVNAAARDAGEQRVTADFLRKFLDRVAPGIYREFDGPAMTPLIAPRPMLLINGEFDALTPVPGFMDAVHAAQRTYAAADAYDHFAYEIEDNTGHKVTPKALQMGVDWLVRWLKP